MSTVSVTDLTCPIAYTNMMARSSRMGAYFMEPKELSKVNQQLFYSSQEPVRGSYNLGLFWECTLGLTYFGFSTGPLQR